jgi:hypothetical protein
MNDVIGYKDNVNPAALIHSEIDFNSFDFTAHKPDSEVQSQTEDDHTTPDPLVRDGNNSKKRRHKHQRSDSASSSPKNKEVLDLFMRKWQKEEEDRELQRQREEARDKRDVEVLNTMKAMASVLERLVGPGALNEL